MLKASIKVLTQSDSPVRSQSRNLLPVKRERIHTEPKPPPPGHLTQVYRAHIHNALQSHQAEAFPKDTATLHQTTIQLSQLTIIVCARQYTTT